MIKLEDNEIIDLYWKRSENAITETDRKYRKKCLYVAGNILKDLSDAEECLNDTYMTAWKLMPPERPVYLLAFLLRIIKNHSLNRMRHLHRSKRKKDLEVSLDELNECCDGKSNTEDAFNMEELINAINDFLDELDKQKRVIFIRKYWFYDTVPQIAQRCSMSEENVKINLVRTRKKLKTYLTERGLYS